MKIFERIIHILSAVFIVLFMGKFVYHLSRWISLIWIDDPWADFFVGVYCFFCVILSLMGITSYVMLMLCTKRMSNAFCTKTMVDNSMR